MNNVVKVFVGLGSNLSEPAQQVIRAFAALAAIPDTRLLARSPLYRSRPHGPQGQPDYINAVALLSTELAPQILLDAFQSIEAAAGRVRGGERWGPRVLDLDLLLYGDAIITDERLTVPHPRLHERGFVLYPLRDIDPGLRVPGRGVLAELIERCPDESPTRLTDPQP